MKVSVIVPVYGVERYLDACVQSIVDQTYRDLEIILIDDGGTDACPQMCDEWKNKDGRIVVLHKENGGQGTARNCALDVATGEYVLFVDSDDYIQQNMVERMLSFVDPAKPSIVFCGIRTYNGLRFTNELWYTNSFAMDKEECMYRYVHDKKILTGPCCKLIHKSVFRSLRFPAFRANEDAYIMHQVLDGGEYFYVIAEHLYVQNLREGSTEKASFNAHKLRLLDCAFALRSFVEERYPSLMSEVVQKPAEEAFFLLTKIYAEKLEGGFSNEIETLTGCLTDELAYLKTNAPQSVIIRRIADFLKNPQRFQRKCRNQGKKIRFKKWLKRCLIKIKG